MSHKPTRKKGKFDSKPTDKPRTGPRTPQDPAERVFVTAARKKPAGSEAQAAPCATSFLLRLSSLPTQRSANVNIDNRPKNTTPSITNSNHDSLLACFLLNVSEERKRCALFSRMALHYSSEAREAWMSG